MSAADVETLRWGYDAFRTEGVDAVLRFLDPEVEITPIREAPGSQTYRGHAGLRQYVDSLRDAFGEFGWDAEEMLDLGSDVLVETRFHGQGRVSGIPVEATVYFLWSFRDGKVVRVNGYIDRDAALAASRESVA